MNLDHVKANGDPVLREEPDLCVCGPKTRATRGCECGSEDSTFNVYAYREKDTASDERRDGIPRWKVSQAVEWALTRGHDTVLVQAGDTAPSSDRLITHHLCRDPSCPGGCA